MRILKSNHRRGVTAVEVAICLPVLMMFLFASYELARANMLLHACESAAYEGARVGIVPGATTDKIEDAVGFVLRSVGATDFDITVTPPVIEDDTNKVQVQVELDLRKNSVITQMLLENPRLRGECELTREVL